MSLLESSRAPSSRAATLASLALLYLAQGIPFGLASEYLPVVLRQSGYTLSTIALLSYLQLPWQLKILWSRAGDHPRTRPHARGILLTLQIGFSLIVACYTLFSLKDAPAFWFTLTALAALFAATQDVFTDALAVRSLAPCDRGYGNIAQVAGYRVGMLAGGAGLLIAGHALGARTTLLACAALILVTSIGAFAAKSDNVSALDSTSTPTAFTPTPVLVLLRHMFSTRARSAILLALTFKLGTHVMGSLIKPSLVDMKWDTARIGWVAVTIGTAMSLAGAFAGGLAHRAVRESRALFASGLAQAVVVAPVLIAFKNGAPLSLTAVAIAAENFASGFGTTILFAALMSATRKRDAGFHYTILTSANAVAIGFGGLLGGLIADHAGKMAAFAIGGVLSLLALVFVFDWERAAIASSSEEHDAPEHAATQASA